MPRELHGMEAGGLRAAVTVFKDSVIRGAHKGYNWYVVFPESERAYLREGLKITMRPRRRGERGVRGTLGIRDIAAPAPPPALVIFVRDARPALTRSR